ncbi:helix-turn-helix domain-containing protein [Sungkyunkwania multivorans]|uniref:Helix-turn-helix domain-containing protein n=1 Tax=Sungkyunkwania multivorans TaxID=1173618 RepID=A0ABW3CXC5_9FLAO
MLNNEDFIDRLRKILDYYALSASSFADTIGVQRSSISHILSGRNKPSLDFVMKILSSFEEVDLYWLLNGQGTFPKASVSGANIISDEKPKTDDLFTASEVVPQEIVAKEKKAEHLSNTAMVEEQPPNVFPKKDGAGIEKIVVFYKDGSFKVYEN